MLNVRIHIILHMRKVSSGHLLSIETLHVSNPCRLILAFAGRFWMKARFQMARSIWVSHICGSFTCTIPLAIFLIRWEKLIPKLDKKTPAFLDIFVSVNLNWSSSWESLSDMKRQREFQLSYDRRYLNILDSLKSYKTQCACEDYNAPMFFFFFFTFIMAVWLTCIAVIWCTTWENGSLFICNQRRPRSACASEQSDLGILLSSAYTVDSRFSKNWCL